MERRRLLGYGLGTTLAFILGCPADNNYNFLEQGKQIQRAEQHQRQIAQQTQVQQREPDYRTNDFSNDNDEVLLARMIFGEARGESEQGRIAVAYSAVNRLQNQRRFGRNLHEVILRRSQYTCFNQGNANRIQLMDPLRYDAARFRQCLQTARNVLGRRAADPTSGANHYFNPNHANPSWADRMILTARIGNHNFYRD